MINKNKIDYSLYLVTDSTLLNGCTLEEAVEKSLSGGCSIVQLREKLMASLDLYNLAKRIKRITDRYGVPLIINDRADIAKSVKAAGVHLGQNDLPLKEAKNILGKNSIIGISANNALEAQIAQRDGADYLGVGAVFSTATKTNTRPLSREGLKEIRDAVTLPIVAIGGIKPDNLPFFIGSGINGVAVASSIIAQPDIGGVAKFFRESIKFVLKQ